MTNQMLHKGDVVKNTVWSNEGLIVAAYKNYWEVEKEQGQFASMSSSSWLSEQTVPFTTDQINEQRWFSILNYDGGSSLCCEGRLEFVRKANVRFVMRKQLPYKTHCDVGCAAFDYFTIDGYDDAACYYHQNFSICLN